MFNEKHNETFHNEYSTILPYSLSKTQLLSSTWSFVSSATMATQSTRVYIDSESMATHIIRKHNNNCRNDVKISLDFFAILLCLA